MTKKTELMTSSSELISVHRDSIDSDTLLDMVNETRKECGEKPIRNNDFVARIKDELIGEFYETFVKPSGLKGGRPSEGIMMQMKQALRVAARESKSVRRSLVDKLEARYQPTPVQRELSTMEILQIALESEKGRLIEKERADHAVRTKSHISRKREASALGKLSAATRKCRDLEERLGESVKHATITKVEGKTGDEYKFVDLRRWCKANGVTAVDVPDPRYGSVKSWPAGAWLDVYGVDLKTLFGEKK
ncbi:ORF6N domain-containing protein [Serratia quinivorans]|uniref:ORF6N domain-containing protein n=1 Tax=Serratia quinivorans TaxID=137545 RepID=UPI002E798F93|nr:ORF6N domain-containing protein [Serratia quinivorans]